MIGPGDVREKLLALIAEDERVRAELVAEGTLFDGYNARMREVHERNAAVLGGLAHRAACDRTPRIPAALAPPARGSGRQR